MKGLLPAVDPRRAEDGLPRAVRASGRAGRGTAWRATSCSIAAHASAASSTRRSTRCSRPRRGPHRRRRPLWSLLNLELWFRTFIDGDGVQTLPHRRRPAHDRRARAASRSAAYAGGALGPYAYPLAESRSPAAARQGREAAHVAPDAPPRAPPRHHVSRLRRPGQPRADIDGMREVAARWGGVRARDPAKGTLAFLLTPRVTC